MFVVSERDTAAIRTAFEGGAFRTPLSCAGCSLGITDSDPARALAETIAGWKPLLMTPPPSSTAAPQQGSLKRMMGGNGAFRA
jgi:hypothetical protein